MSLAEQDPERTLDDQHDEYRLLTDLDDDLHEYVRQYIKDGEFL